MAGGLLLPGRRAAAGSSPADPRDLASYRQPDHLRRTHLGVTRTYGQWPAVTPGGDRQPDGSLQWIPSGTARIYNRGQL